MKSNAGYCPKYKLQRKTLTKCITLAAACITAVTRTVLILKLFSWVVLLHEYFTCVYATCWLYKLLAGCISSLTINRALNTGLDQHQPINSSSQSSWQLLRWPDMAALQWHPTPQPTNVDHVMPCSPLQKLKCVGVYSSESQWSEIFGDSFTGGSSRPLW